VEGRELEEIYAPEAEWDPECLRPGPNEPHQAGGVGFVGTLEERRSRLERFYPGGAQLGVGALGDDVFARDLLSSEYGVALFMIDKNRPMLNRLNKKTETALETALRAYRQRMLLRNESDLMAYEPWIRFPELWTAKEWSNKCSEADFVDIYRERIIFHYGSELGATIEGQKRQKGIGRMIKMYAVPPLSRERLF
jgi:hypothetical protein